MSATGYQSGFGNHFASEAVPGALPVSAPLEVETTPSQLRWSPLAIPREPTDFIEGLVTMCANGDVRLQTGMAAHFYLANSSMSERYFYNADGELLVVPQQGAVRFVTELGVIDVAPGEIAVIPCGVRFRVELPDGPSRGYVCENYGALFRLPELGPLGSNGLANMSAHGPDADTAERASNAALAPHKVADTMAFMFESRFALSVSEFALRAAQLQPGYFEAWPGIKRRFPKQGV